jgi:hypothetical protein
MNQVGFATVRVEGSILPIDLLQRIAAGDASLGGLRPEDYHLAGEKINEAINHAWNRLLPTWDAFKATSEKLPLSDTGHTTTLNKWLLPLWRTLEYGQLDAAKPFKIDGKEYAISHIRYHSPIHLVGSRLDLDKRVDTSAGKRPSPHGLVQEFLNRSGDHIWGFVSNGLTLRILRDNIRLTRQAFVEFDLQAMFDGKVYSDFALLWRLCHESRVHGDTPEQCWLERWSKSAAEQGLRALDQLRGGVENAVEALGRGFLQPVNAALVQNLRSGTLKAMDYYRQLLRVVYRLLFLFATEDRELLHDPAAPDAARDRYAHYYSTGRLRRMAERFRGTQHTDLYQGLNLVLARLGTTGCPELGLPALGGLFDLAGTPDLADCRIGNADLLEAVRALAVVSDGRSLRPVDYRNLGSEELGSVYESLLELHPQFTPDPPAFVLKSASGNERKTTGSYYTPTSLITCLLDSALDPVLDEAAAKPDPEKAILDLKVCDPACGSGHFLIAAAHRIAKRLASVRMQEEEPAPNAIRHALRHVISRCIFGVDINPMAVELCQVALWMEALEPGKPLSFLRHHVQCGNSLLGATPALLANGIPDEAFDAIEGDDRKLCRAFKRQNRDERRGQGDMFADLHPWELLGDTATAIAGFDALPEDTAEQVRAKEQLYERLVAEESYRTSGRFLADLWCAAFVWKKTLDVDFPVTERIFRRIEKSPHDVMPWMYQEVRRLAKQYRFLHWQLAFPGVFRPPAKGETPDNELTGWCGGFSVVLGNPPWERIKLQEQEWFAAHGRADVAEAKTGAVRSRMIKELEVIDPSLHRAFLEDRRKSEGESHLVRDSSGMEEETDRRWGMYPLCGRGDVNTYSLFAELNRNLINPTGRVGCIVPSGIATDDTTKLFFHDLAGSGSLVSLLSFSEIRLIFIETDSRNPFCLLTLTGIKRPAHAAVFVFDARSVEDLGDPTKRFGLSSDDLDLLNPNTRTCPVFRSGRDAMLIKAIYRRIPVLALDNTSRADAWCVFYLRLVDYGDHSKELLSRDYLTAEGYTFAGSVLVKEEDRCLPVYESKMIRAFDHRGATYVGNDQIVEVGVERHLDATYQVMPKFWVRESFFKSIMAKYDYQPEWFLTYRDVARTSDTRTLIATAIPRVPASRKLPVLGFKEDSLNGMALLANLNCFLLDYVARQKMGGTSLAFFILKQLPLIPPSVYLKTAPWSDHGSLREWVVERALELAFTAWDLEPLANECGYHSPPHRWDEERRFQVRCELDAAYFHLYLGTGEWRASPEEDTAEFQQLKETFPTPRQGAEYIMDTFQLVRQADEERHGRFRTKERVLELYDQMGHPVAKPVPAESILTMHVVVLLQTWRKEVTRDDFTLGLALVLNDGARKAVLNLSLSAEEQRQLDDLPEYAVRLDELLVRLTAQDFVTLREHEGLLMVAAGAGAPPFGQAPAAERERAEQAIQAITAMQPDKKSTWRVKLHA